MCDIQVILVPAGAEYKAVRRGLDRLKKASKSLPQLVAIPAGPVGLSAFLKTEDKSLQSKVVLLIGLGGSLSPQLDVGDGVAVERLWTEAGDVFECDRHLTAQIAKRLDIRTGAGVTCDRVITKAEEKQTLGDRYSADIIEMEGATLLKTLPESKVAVLRVVSDDCRGDLPDISRAIAPDGSLRPMYLLISFASSPLSAARLIRDALKSLKKLENLAYALF